MQDIDIVIVVIGLVWTGLFAMIGMEVREYLRDRRQRKHNSLDCPYKR